MSLKHKTAIATVAAVSAALLAVSASARDMVVRENGVTDVNAPTTQVRVDEQTGSTRVKVRTHATRVDVDTDQRHVRIRVPYYSGDIRW